MIIIRPDNTTYTFNNYYSNNIYNISLDAIPKIYTVPGWYQILNSLNGDTEIYMIDGKITATHTGAGDYYCYVDSHFYCSRTKVEHLSKLRSFI